MTKTDHEHNLELALLVLGPPLDLLRLPDSELALVALRLCGLGFSSSNLPHRLVLRVVLVRLFGLWITCLPFFFLLPGRALARQKGYGEWLELFPRTLSHFSKSLSNDESPQVLLVDDDVIAF